MVGSDTPPTQGRAPPSASQARHEESNLVSGITAGLPRRDANQTANLLPHIGAMTISGCDVRPSTLAPETSYPDSSRVRTARMLQGCKDTARMWITILAVCRSSQDKGLQVYCKDARIVSETSHVRTYARERTPACVRVRESRFQVLSLHPCSRCPISAQQAILQAARIVKSILAVSLQYPCSRLFNIKLNSYKR